MTKVHSPAQNTKVESLAEAIEGVIAGTCAQMLARESGGTPSPALNDTVKAARNDLRDALKGFLVPALRLVEGGPYQTDPDRAPKDRVRCAACDRERCCSDVQCPNWHAAVRKTIGGNDALAFHGGDVA